MVYRSQTNSNLTDWAYGVKYRDNFTCQDCGAKPNNPMLLQAHHIKPKRKYPKLQFDISNGITLCFECHKKADLETFK